MLVTNLAQPNNPYLFRHLIVANSRYWLSRVEREAQAVLPETPQLFKALSYALDLPEAVGIAYDLLHHLSPLMIRQGQFQIWERLLSRGITRSAAENHPVEIELRLHLGNIYRLQGRLMEAEECLEAGLTLCEQHGDSPHERTLLNYLGLVARLAGQQEAALAYSRRVLSHPNLSPTERAEALNVMGFVAFDRREWNEALNYFDQALSIYHLMADNYHIARLLNNRGLAFWKSGQLDDARISYEEANAHFQAVGDQTESFKPIMNLGIVFWKRKEYQAAILKFKEALSIFKQNDYLFEQAHVYNNLGMAYRGLQDWSTAETYFRASAEIWQNIGDQEYYLANVFDNLGMMFTEAGDLLQAETNFNKALTVLDGSKSGPAEKDLRVKVEKRLKQLES